MRISDILQRRGRSISFEFFPPKDQKGEDNLFKTVGQILPLWPTFVSVTYGAGGSTMKNTYHVVERLKHESALTIMPHLTCIDQHQAELETVVSGYRKLGIENILVLRGDSPKETSQTDETAKPVYARDLVKWISSTGDFSIGVAVYPEGHGESPNLDLDMLYTKQKVDAGADFAITQMFFDNRYYYAFMERAERIGLNVPVIAGVMPIIDPHKIQQFCLRCGASLPASCINRFGDGALSPPEARKISIELISEQCSDLLENGVRYFHFYTLNHWEIVTEVVKNLGLETLGLDSY